MYAGEARTMKYASATYGSLAYDMGRVAQPEFDYEEAPAAKPKRQKREEVKVAVRPKKKAAAKQRIAPFGVLGLLTAALMLVLVLMGNVQLAALSAEASEVQDHIAELQNEEAKLKIQYERVFELDKVEQYAVNQLGMIPSSSGRVYYLNGSTPDKAVIIKGADNNTNVFKSINTFLSRVVEYFK